KPHHVSFQILSYIEATAYFINILAPAKLPCRDKERGLANPLVEMKIAPTSKWKTNYIGSTFGWTRTDRDGNRKHHSGIDLYAEPGTPLYAICNGVISKTDKYVTCQPMRIGKKTYPPGYKGDENGAGNRFTLEGTIDGEIVKFSYWHLDAGKPVAINPRTGQPFRPGDRVYRGEVIAYSGRTGNANEIEFPHLHLTVTKNGSRINPEDYLNGKVSRSPDNRKISSTEITGIKCDEEDKELFADYAF
ncbi:MAG: M23 family metallopeptidase, partial [Bacteroidales bacterium]|nr:M23 family metallopeptidase [Bacteroidales bacterium]